MTDITGFMRPCEGCNGSGVVDGRYCPDCDGVGICDDTTDTLVSTPETMTDVQAFRKRFDTAEMRANGVEIDDDYSAAAGAWGDNALQGEKPEDAVRRLRDGLSAPVAPPKPPEVDTRCVLLDDTEGLIGAHQERYTVAGKKGIWVIFYRLKED